MDLQITSESFDTADWTWLASSFATGTGKPVTILLTTFVEATHYPNGRIKPGTILAKYTSGANSGLWGPYVSNDTVAEGLGTPAGILLDGARVRKDASGVNVSTVTVGACLIAGTPVQVNVANLPGLLLEDGTTAYAPLAADLPSAAVAVDLM